MNTKAVVETEKKVVVEQKFEDKLEELGADAVVTVILPRKVKVADREFTEIKLDFDALTGRDVEEASAAAQLAAAQRKQVIFVETDKLYLMYIVCRAANKAGTKLNINELMEFPAKAVSELTMRAQGFLLG